ncbi:hypothetical protein DFP93_103162 [Aneurinibacillus soli]|uniref:Uncharacterized protein n=1 Tax=Aneurinibacillus soli TaxID=1500254 RepID=A0A0U5BLC7_9BACL|nr:hypothetical protein [Aneurinibacillus soli]PYE62951.1 hypothetical protein DFP93_103162 [Aneurinibacillus soli]BAU28990.1 hypothetical protein CB4_03168 [Aneurinibacillus soli]
MSEGKYFKDGVRLTVWKKQISFLINCLGNPIIVGIILCITLNIPLYIFSIIQGVFLFKLIQEAGIKRIGRDHKLQVFIFVALFLPQKYSLLLLSGMLLWLVSRQLTYEKFETAYIRFVVQLISLGLFVAAYYKLYFSVVQHYLPIISFGSYILAGIIIYFFIWYLYIFLHSFMKEIEKIDFETDVKMYKVNLGTAIFNLLIAIAIPDIMFSFLYYMEFQMVYFNPEIYLYNIKDLSDKELSLAEMFYFSFGIHYSLPLSEPYSDFQEFINQDTLFKVVQVLHVVISKIIDLTVISLIATIIADRIRYRK